MKWMIKKYNLPLSKQGFQGMIVFSLITVMAMALFVSTESNYSSLLLILLIPNYWHWANVDTYREYSLEYNKQLSNVAPTAIINYIQKNRLDDSVTCKYLKVYMEKYHSPEANLYSNVLNSL
jgi:c-di-AMP phosphodiesterase-like protein